MLGLLLSVGDLEGLGQRVGSLSLLLSEVDPLDLAGRLVVEYKLIEPQVLEIVLLSVVDQPTCFLFVYIYCGNLLVELLYYQTLEQGELVSQN